MRHGDVLAMLGKLASYSAWRLEEDACEILSERSCVSVGDAYMCTLGLRHVDSDIKRAITVGQRKSDSGCLCSAGTAVLDRICLGKATGRGRETLWCPGGYSNHGSRAFGGWHGYGRRLVNSFGGLTERREGVSISRDLDPRAVTRYLWW